MSNFTDVCMSVYIKLDYLASQAIHLRVTFPSHVKVMLGTLKTHGQAVTCKVMSNFTDVCTSVYQAKLTRKVKQSSWRDFSLQFLNLPKQWTPTPKWTRRRRANAQPKTHVYPELRNAFEPGLRGEDTPPRPPAKNLASIYSRPAGKTKLVQNVAAKNLASVYSRPAGTEKILRALPPAPRAEGSGV